MSSGFMDGFAEGFANSYSQSFDAAERRKLFLEEQNKKKKENLNKLRPAALTKLQEQEELRAQLTYLEERGLPPETVSAMYQNPDILTAAYEFATTNPDATPEILSIAYKSKPIGGQDVEHWKISFDRTYDVYRSVAEGTVEDPEAALTDVGLVRPRTASVEIRDPEKGKPGVEAENTRRWEEQEKAFDRQVTALGQRYLNSLVEKMEAGTATDAELDEIAILQRDLSKYGKADEINSTLNVRKIVGPMAMEYLLNSDMDPNVLFGLEKNPRLFLIGEEAGTEWTVPEVVDSAPVQPSYVQEIDGKVYHYFELPDGKFRKVRVK